jgi:hypothetical protein
MFRREIDAMVFSNCGCHSGVYHVHRPMPMPAPTRRHGKAEWPANKAPGFSLANPRRNDNNAPSFGAGSTTGEKKETA